MVLGAARSCFGDISVLPWRQSSWQLDVDGYSEHAINSPQFDFMLTKGIGGYNLHAMYIFPLGEKVPF